MSLEQELETFRRELPGLLKAQEGILQPKQFVLIHGNQVHSTWETEGDGLQAGYMLFGDEPFLVKRIAAEEKVILARCKVV